MVRGQKNNGHTMQVIDLDGNTHHWQLLGGISHGSINNKSSLHLRARDLIKKIYPTMQILEEVPIQLRKSEVLFLDFYVPLIKKCIEVHGEQHYKFNRFFHKTMLGFVRSRKRDVEKREWCTNNGILYIELPYNKQDTWENEIRDEH